MTQWFNKKPEEKSPVRHFLDGIDDTDNIILALIEHPRGIQLRGPRSDVPPSLIIEACERIIEEQKKRLQ